MCLVPDSSIFTAALLPIYSIFTSYISLLLVDCRKKTIPDGFLHQAALYREFRGLEWAPKEDRQDSLPFGYYR